MQSVKNKSELRRASEKAEKETGKSGHSQEKEIPITVSIELLSSLADKLASNRSAVRRTVQILHQIFKKHLCLKVIEYDFFTKSKGKWLQFATLPLYSGEFATNITVYRAQHAKPIRIDTHTPLYRERKSEFSDEGYLFVSILMKYIDAIGRNYYRVAEELEIPDLPEMDEALTFFVGRTLMLAVFRFIDAENVIMNLIDFLHKVGAYCRDRERMKAIVGFWSHLYDQICDQEIFPPPQLLHRVLKLRPEDMQFVKRFYFENNINGVKTLFNVAREMIQGSRPKDLNEVVFLFLDKNYRATIVLEALLRMLIDLAEVVGYEKEEVTEEAGGANLEYNLKTMYLGKDYKRILEAEKEVINEIRSAGSVRELFAKLQNIFEVAAEIVESVHRICKEWEEPAEIREIVELFLARDVLGARHAGVMERIAKMDDDMIIGLINAIIRQRCPETGF